jgi:hypothetical protein
MERPACQNGSPQQILCQTLCQIGIANIMPNKNLFSSIFFICLSSFDW